MALCQPSPPPVLSLELGLALVSNGQGQHSLMEVLRLQREKAAWLINPWYAMTREVALWTLGEPLGFICIQNKQEETRGLERWPRG